MVNNNKYNSIKPYRAHNMMIKNLEVQPDTVPTNNINEQEPSADQVGYINVGVYTASGALPVKDAVVVVYHTYNNGEEHILYHLVTDESGRVPKIEVPIVYRGIGEQTEYTYSTYNLRVQAIGYYLVNILDVQVFPNIATNYRINLIPAAQGVPSEVPEQTIVIPPRPDITQ
ncbi:MAG: hypothetical protein AB7V48_06945 [Sedimentibacter sp.]